jgi:hypothetical protein
MYFSDDVFGKQIEFADLIDDAFLHLALHIV